jgi:hypothetical protein
MEPLSAIPIRPASRTRQQRALPVVACVNVTPVRRSGDAHDILSQMARNLVVANGEAANG